MNGRRTIDMNDLFSFMGKTDDKEKLVELGVASDQLWKRFAEHTKKREALEEELQEESVKAILDIRRRYSAQVEALQEEHNAIWREIKDSLGLPHDIKLAMDPQTGTIAGRGNRTSNQPADILPFPNRGLVRH